MPKCRSFMRNHCDTKISCEVAALQFQAHANYGAWSIDYFASNKDNLN